MDIGYGRVAITDESNGAARGLTGRPHSLALAARRVSPGVRGGTQPRQDGLVR
ncbi:hypothetical protein DO72_2414 [Burkholderia pseudomallei]|nr:hypothetical protein DO72_2414 [Burkholderia pseudomallei]